MNDYDKYDYDDFDNDDDNGCCDNDDDNDCYDNDDYDHYDNEKTETSFQKFPSRLLKNDVNGDHDSIHEIIIFISNKYSQICYPIPEIGV